jgi:hypothetical protein
MPFVLQLKAEKVAAQLRGQGVALFREEVAKGMAESAKVMKDNQLDASLILFSMWTEAIKHFAEQGKGNVFLGRFYGRNGKNMKQLTALQQLKEVK